MNEDQNQQQNQKTQNTNEPDTPAPLRRKPSFGLQALAGVITDGVLAALVFNVKGQNDILTFVLYAVPLVGVTLCIIPRTRGFGCGLLLGLGLAALILFGVCMTAMKNI